MPEIAPPLSVAGLTHRFSANPTLLDVSLSVSRGHIVSVVGPSGSGKTTLLRCIAGFATPSEGEIRVAGVPVIAAGRELVVPERRRVGMVFQDYALFPHLTVEENVAFGIRRDPERRPRVQRLLSLTGLSGLRTRRPAELSGGEQQRVALARALAPRPDVLLLDEPFANVDADRRGGLLAELKRILISEGTSVLLVTHDRFEALAISDRVAVLGLTEAGGRLLQIGTPEAVYRTPASVEVARITGEARLLAGRAAGSRVTTALGAVPLIEAREGPVQVLLRPESVRWDGGAGGGGSAVVVESQFLGRGYRVWCETPAGPILFEHGGPSPPPPGSRGQVSLSGPCWAFPAATGGP